MANIIRCDAPTITLIEANASVGSTDETLWVETPKTYLTSLYQAVLELSFISLLLSVHTVYHIYGIDLIPSSHLKTVSKALVLLLGILRLAQPVRYALLRLRATPKRE